MNTESQPQPKQRKRKEIALVQTYGGLLSVKTNKDRKERVGLRNIIGLESHDERGTNLPKNRVSEGHEGLTYG